MATESGLIAWRKVLAVVLAAALLLVLAGPFLLRREQAGAGDRLTIISPHSETIEDEFERAFSDWMIETDGRSVGIEWLDVGGTTQAIKFVQDQFERSPDGIDVDVFFGGGSDPFLQFGKKGLLHRCNIPEDILARIPRTHAGTELYDEDQRWFGACMSGFGILYNKQLLTTLKLPEPETWADLGRPDYFTWVASADPRQSGSMHMLYEIILQAYGWDEGWGHIVRIGANSRSFSRAASDVPKEIAIGEAACGMAIDYYALQTVAETGADKMGFVLPQKLTVVNPDGIGVLKGAPNAELAELFVQFVLSERGQRLWMLRKGAPGGPKEHQLYRLSVIPGMVEKYGRDSAVQVDPFKFEGGFAFDLAKKNSRWGILNDLLGACIIDVHDELAKAWETLRALPEDRPRARLLLAPPVSESELLEMARQKWDDPGFRADTIAAWSRRASETYREAAGGK